MARFSSGTLVLLVLAVALAASFHSIDAATYYVAPNGDDSRTPEQARSSMTPWKSLSTVQANVLNNNIGAGDIVALERGGIYYGTLELGSMFINLTITAYGSANAALPVIAGAREVPKAGWSVHSGSIWKANVAGLVSSSVYSVYVDGARMNLARWPNSPIGTDAPTFSRIQNGAGDGGTTWDDNTLDRPDGALTGAKVKWRSTHFTWAASNVTHSRNGDGSAHFLTQDNYYGGIYNDHGYWLEGIFGELDYAGEWFYDAGTTTLYLWTPQSTSPAAHTVEIVVERSGIRASAARNCEISYIRFTKFGGSAIYLGTSSSSNILISNNIIDSTEGTGIEIINAGKITASGNTISTCEARGIQFEGTVTDSSITHNSIKDIGFVRATCTGINCAIGIVVGANTKFVDVSFNRVEHIGYIGIRFDGKNHTIHHNYVASVTKTLSDGGAIYAWGDYSMGTELSYNVAHDGFPSTYMLPSGSGGISHCLYFDDYVSEMYAHHNTLYNCYSSGIYFHDSNDVLVEENLIYNNTQTQIFVFEQFGEFVTRNNVARKNIIFSGSVGSNLVTESTVYTRTDLFGSYSDNILCSPYDRSMYTAFYQAVGDRQSGNIECTIPESSGIQIDQVLGLNLINPGSWVGVTNVGWSVYPANTTVQLVDEPKCEQKCVLWSMPDCCYENTQAVLMYTSTTFSLKSGAQYLLDAEVFTSQNGHISIVPRSNVNYANLSPAVTREITSMGLNRIYALVLPTVDTNNARLDFEVKVPQQQVWVKSVSLTEVSATIRRYDSIITNTGYAPMSQYLPNGQQYIDPTGKTVTYTLTLPAMSGVVLFDQGYNSSLVGPPQGPPSTGDNPGSNGPTSPPSSSTIVDISSAALLVLVFTFAFLHL